MAAGKVQSVGGPALCSKQLPLAFCPEGTRAEGVNVDDNSTYNRCARPVARRVLGLQPLALSSARAE
jgi:hypothetical protein